jgi:hypothetical protein
MRHGRPAARAEGRPFDVAHLRHRAADLVGRGRRARVAIANREPTDLTGGPQIAFHERRRQRLHVGDVVETVTDGVGRQKLRDVNLEIQQVGDGAGVLGAIQALKGPLSRIGIERGHTIEPGFERFGKRGKRGRLRTFGAGRRHHAETKLPNHLLGDRGVGFGLGGIKRRE